MLNVQTIDREEVEDNNNDDNEIINLSLQHKQYYE